jgi:hypothetical protein
VVRRAHGRARSDLANRHHYRDSARFAERFACSVHCNRTGVHEFSHGEAVRGFDVGDWLAGGVLACELDAICPDDTALYLPEQRALVIADGVVRGGLYGQPGRLGSSWTAAGAPLSSFEGERGTR